ncbi:hypothetical protein BCR35DRAFT_262402 [Leucosporidium creatinivorum]|uniref:Proteophosphoglycan ppg4 n=1 Tax=Leucosporidium creatinivorum TaxID=106004 RepID=A0A1Y2G1K5_9BASI|nr:hypothetical protein BCR35DRAFT_262402 [Leucosporidium creatinivorum]
MPNTDSVRGFSSNPRWKRHLSLDAGVGQFRSRMNSTYDGEYSPLSTPGYDGSEEKPLLSPWGSPMRPVFDLEDKKKKNKLTLALGCVMLLLVGAMGGVALLNRPEAEDWYGVKSKLEEYGVKFDHASCANPYQEFGRIQADQAVPENNRWTPYDPTCSPPELMKALRSTIQPSMSDKPLVLPLPKQRPALNESLPLPWLQGRTVVLFGDHVERLHNKDFCRFAGGRFVTISADHPLSPPRFVNGIDEKLPGANQPNFDSSRPSVCYVEEYDFVLVSVFHFGLANRPEFEREKLLLDPYFYPPVALDDRLSHILLPILRSLDRTHPDLIEFSSGFWDLRHFTALDEVANLDPFSDLTSDRLEWYASRLHQAFQDLGSAFPKTPLMWRALHHTPKFANTPYSRVAALDNLSRMIVRDLNLAKKREKLEVHGTSPSAGSKKSKSVKSFFKGAEGHEAFIDRVKGRIGKGGQKIEQIALGAEEANLKGMIRVDEWGSLMLGQQHLMNNVHTPPLPGGFIWGDLMLFE